MNYPLFVAFIWHMHQPYYRDLATRACSMPWVRLHGTKDYLDMVKRLESFPKIHQTFNLVPSLLDQLEEYLPPVNDSDIFLDLSRKKALELNADDQQFLLKWFFLANVECMIKPHLRYYDLLAKRGLHVRKEQWPDVCKRFKPQDYLDLQVWFNLVWIDPWLRKEDPILSAIEQKGKHFTEEEKEKVLDSQLRILAEIIPAYRAAEQRGQIELTASPYYHPILPLLCESKAALVAMPQCPMPTPRFQAPEDARWQIEKALLRHQRAFGQLPKGMWPSEGSVSDDVAEMVADAGLRWIATDEEILWRTLRKAPSEDLLYRPHILQKQGKNLAIIFRDRKLSDLVGFVYSQWTAKEAVSDFCQRLEGIHARHKDGKPALVSVILDGENAWEFYRNDGHEFFEALYESLSKDERFCCVTVSEYLERFAGEETSLPSLFSGSWIDANFATWIGHEEKNAAWSHLARARAALADKRREDPAFAKAWKSFGIAEGSDWMWWFGDTHFTAQADEFDRLFRQHVANAYRFAELEPPSELNVPIRRQSAHALEMPTGLIQPTIEGQDTSYYEWLYAGSVDLRQQYSAIHRAEQYLRLLRYGLDRENLYLRCDFDAALRVQLPRWSLIFEFAKALRLRVTHEESATQASFFEDPSQPPVVCAFDQILELSIPLAAVNPSKNDLVPLSLELQQDDAILERYPAEGSFLIAASPGVLERLAWPI